MLERPSFGFEDVSTVVSCLPVSIRENKPGLHLAEYFIPGVNDPFTQINTIIVARSSFAVYLDESRPALIIPEPSDRVAEAICRDYRVSMAHTQKDVAEPGLFWLAGRREEAALLNGSDKDGHKALTWYRDLQKEWFTRLVSEADEYWQRIRSRRAISDLQRAACTILNLKREWNLKVEIQEALNLCKFCFSQVHPNAIVCPNCSGILDMARYKSEFSKAEKAEIVR
jgi:hypothetical protein